MLITSRASVDGASVIRYRANGSAVIARQTIDLEGFVAKPNPSGMHARRRGYARQPTDECHAWRAVPPSGDRTWRLHMWGISDSGVRIAGERQLQTRRGSFNLVGPDARGESNRQRRWRAAARWILRRRSRIREDHQDVFCTTRRNKGLRRSPGIEAPR